MRALKAVLMMAGGLKRVCKQDPEAVVVIRALRDANLPKLLTDVSAGDWTFFVGRAVALLSLQHHYGRLQISLLQYVSLSASLYNESGTSHVAWSWSCASPSACRILQFSWTEPSQVVYHSLMVDFSIMLLLC
jgi:hypothetical protein